MTCRRFSRAVSVLVAAGCGSVPGSRSGARTDDPDPRISVVQAYPACEPATGDALFAPVDVPGLTDVIGSTRGTAFVDVDDDGMVDAVLARRRVELFVNRGCLAFSPHQLSLTGELPGTRSNAPTFADFDGNGRLDFYLPSSGRDHQAGFFVAGDRWDQFEDLAEVMGVANPGAYARGEVSVADVDRDGYLDMVVGANQIGGSRALGRPLTRFYLYRPAADGVYSHGRFEDIGGTDRVPGFGGIDPDTCHPGVDINGMGLALRDLDDDGDLDLLHLAHNDMNLSGGGVTAPTDRCANGENPFGMFAWSNQTTGGDVRFEPIAPGNGTIAQHGQMRFDPELGYYTPVSHAVGHEAPGFGDADNDGDLDLVTTGPTSPGWHVHSDPIAGSYWRNDGELHFTDATDAAGLGSLNWTIGEWDTFWGQVTPPDPPPSTDPTRPDCTETGFAPLCARPPRRVQQLYPGMTVWADFDNDGWQDLLFTVRLDRLKGRVRNVLYMNRGDGTFEPASIEHSGIDELSLAAQAVDVDGDGLLDLFFMSRRSGEDSPDEDVHNFVLRNTGRWRGKDVRAHHWLRVQLTGLPHDQLLGAKIFAHDGAGKLLGRRDVFVDVFRGSRDTSVHFGLGGHDSIRLRVILPDGRELTFADVPVDATVAVDVR